MEVVRRKPLDEAAQQRAKDAVANFVNTASFFIGSDALFDIWVVLASAGICLVALLAVIFIVYLIRADPTAFRPRSSVKLAYLRKAGDNTDDGKTSSLRTESKTLYERFFGKKKKTQ